MVTDKNRVEETAYPSFKYLRHVREGMALMDFVRAKRTEKVIAEEHFQEIERIRNDLFQLHGMFEGTKHQPALHRQEEMEAVVRVNQRANQLIREKLLAWYPGLANEVNQLSTAISR